MTIIRPSRAIGEEHESQVLRTRAARGEVDRLYPGAYFEPTERAFDALKPEARHAIRIAAAAPALRTGVVRGVSAAVLHGLPLPARLLDAPIRIARATGGPGSQWFSVRRAAFAPEETTTRYGIATTTVERTLLDLCSDKELDYDELLAVADAALHLGVRLTAEHAGPRNAKRVAFVAEHASTRSESPYESMSRSIMIRHGLPMPIEQLEVRNAEGVFVGRSDFGWPDLGALGEYDGKAKYDELVDPEASATQVIIAEKRREQNLRLLGWSLGRWTSDSVHEPKLLVDTVRTVLDAARALPAPSGTYRPAPPRRRKLDDWSELLETSRDACVARRRG